MPYTLAHAAAVVPLGRRAGDRLPLSALVVGSVSPDLLYFFGSHDGGLFAHTPVGLLLLAVPLGGLLLIFFRTALARPAILLFPPAHQARLQAAAARPLLRRPLPARLASITAALIVGAATHVLWDQLTHDELATGPLAPLRRALVQTESGALSFATALQYASSAAGLGLLFLWYRRWCARAPAPHAVAGRAPSPLPERIRFACLAFGAGASPLLGWLWVAGAEPFSVACVVWVIGTTSAAFLLLCLFCAVVLATARV